MPETDFIKLKSKIMQPMTTNVDLIKMAEHLKINLHDVLNKDYLEHIKPLPGSYIVNLNNSDKPGSHWICFYLNNGVAYYFDSFGVSPPLEVLKFIKRYTRRIYINDKTIQKLNSGGCGLYCLMFLYHMTHYRLPKQTGGKLAAFKKFITFFR